jgi:hypothetical protein
MQTLKASKLKWAPAEPVRIASVLRHEQPLTGVFPSKWEGRQPAIQPSGGGSKARSGHSRRMRLAEKRSQRTFGLSR